MRSHFRNMSDQQRWKLYHQLCDKWLENHPKHDEQDFMAYVKKLTKDMGL